MEEILEEKSPAKMSDVREAFMCFDARWLTSLLYLVTSVYHNIKKIKCAS